MKQYSSAFDLGGVLASESWSAEQIRARSDRLAKLAFTEVSALSQTASGQAEG